MVISEEEYKQAKIDFVSNLSGSNRTDLLVVFAVAALCSLFHRNVAPLAPKNVFFKFVFEMLYMVGPPLFVITYSDWSYHLYFVMVLISAICFVIWQLTPIRNRQSKRPSNSKQDKLLESLNSPRKPFLDEYRATHMMLMTCLAILAVDFTIFPRKFAKTETYGISVMDMGVGCVVLSGALVSRQARVVGQVEKAKKEDDKGKAKGGDKGRLYFAWGALKSSLPLLILGLVRIILTKSANYHEHVSEYGVHWNFFFTLCFVALFSALVNVPTKYSAFAGLAIVAGYQFVLSNLGLKEYILNHPRDSIISANKEGLSSIFGYLAIYLVGVQLGGYLFTPRPTKKQWYRVGLVIIVATLIAFACAYASETFIDPVSRRMANLPYVLYTIAYTLYTLGLCIIVSLFFENSPSVILSAINRNQLFFFLLGNIMTGLINISIYTLYKEPVTAISVVYGYIFVLCSIVLFLDKRNIVLRI